MYSQAPSATEASSARDGPTPTAKPRMRRQWNADRGDKKRVEQPDPERPTVGRERRIRDEVQVDVETRDFIPEAEAHRNSAGLHIHIGVVGAADNQGAEDRDRAAPDRGDPATGGR